MAWGRDSIFPAEVLPPPQEAALLCGGPSSFKIHHGLIYSLDTKIQELFKYSKSVLSLELSPWATKHKKNCKTKENKCLCSQHLILSSSFVVKTNMYRHFILFEKSLLVSFSH